MAELTDYQRGFFSTFKPIPTLWIDEWADRYRFLPRSGSAETGDWKTDRAPYLRPIMRALSPADRTREVVVVKAAQLGATEILLNALLFYIDQTPGPILLYEPTGNDVAKLESQRLKPSIQKCPPVLKKLQKDTIIMKTFMGGGVLMLNGTNSPNSMASTPAKYILMDEVERYPLTIANEGDPVELARKRAATYRDAKIAFISTPTTLKNSRIWALYQDSTQSVFAVPCPHCGKYQELAWENMRWEPGKPETAWYCCPECGAEIKEHHKTKMLANLRVVEQNPGHFRAGFKVSTLYAPVGWTSWQDMAREYEACGDDPEKMRSFRNLYLGLPWEEDGDRVTLEELATEEYGTDVPPGVMILTLAVDVQSSPARLEYEIRGWGPDEESYGIKYGAIHGDPGQLTGIDPEHPSVWEALDELRKTTFTRRDGFELNVGVTCVDSGGHYTDTVYRYCKDRERLRVFAIRGSPNYERPIVGQPSRNNRIKAILFNVGVSQAKDLIYSRLKIKATPGAPNPGYCHFPADPKAGYNEAYFSGLTCESKIKKYVNGYLKYLWVKPAQAHNEPLDLFVYGLHALRIFQPNWKQVAARVERIKKIMAERRAAPSAVEKPEYVERMEQQRAPEPATRDTAGHMRGFLGGLG